MTYRARIEEMVRELKADPRIDVKVARIGRPTAKAKLALMRRSWANATSLQAFYEEIGSLDVRWQLRRDRLDSGLHAWAANCNDGDFELGGYIGILPYEQMFDSWYNRLWFDDTPVGDLRRYSLVLDLPNDGAVGWTVVVQRDPEVLLTRYHPSDAVLGSRRMTFDAWLDRTLEARGAFGAAWASGPFDAELARVRSIFDRFDASVFAR